MSWPWPFPLYAAAALIAYRALRFFQVLKAYGYVAGARPPLDPHSLPGNAIPATWWHMGFMWPWTQRKTAHFNHTHDLTAIVPLLVGNGAYFAASAGVAKQVWGNEVRTRLLRPKDFTTERVWGSSIASANGEDWRRHRRIVAPTFTSDMLARLVDESAVVYKSMNEALLGTNESVVNNMHVLLLRFTFVMICRCGFGMPVGWTQSAEHDEIAVFDRALSVASTTLILRLIFPNWVWSLPIKRLRETNESWKTVMALVDAIAARRQAEYAAHKELGEDGIHDLLTKLVSATDGTAKYALAPPEVVRVCPVNIAIFSLNGTQTANMMSLLFAGNETTSSALLSTIVLLGLHPDEQETAYQEILREVPSPENMTLRDVVNLKYVLACMHEAHRLVPATINLPRDVPEDIVLRSSRPVEKDVLVQKGSRIMVDIMAVCHNPNDFPDPEAYKPARWRDVPDHDVIMFGFGPRACVGRKFAQTEAVCFLAHFLRDWKVETMHRGGEMRQACFDRIMAGASMYGTAFGLGEVPVKITARTL
ncbi:cytochrome P450 [Mycena sp. CBHHK59/15]|nr:cytochrome P450 [Mycena sp. CBHHK59/15]